MATIKFDIKLTFDDAKVNGESIYATENYFEHFAAGNLHSGATFPGTIELDEDTAEEFIDMMKQGVQVVFWTSGNPGDS